jgi:hypothetical protein
MDLGELLENCRGRGGRNKLFGCFVVRLDIAVDFILQFSDGSEDAAASFSARDGAAGPMGGFAGWFGTGQRKHFGDDVGGEWSPTEPRNGGRIAFSNRTLCHLKSLCYIRQPRSLPHE